MSLNVKLFDGVTAIDCLWGDANHDNVVNAMDASLILRYTVGNAMPDGVEFCTVRTDVVNDGNINAMDASRVLKHCVDSTVEMPVYPNN